MKVVINRCFGGFGVSHEAFLWLRAHGHAGALKETDIGERWDADSPKVRSEGLDSFLDRDTNRADSLLVQVVEELGPKASAPMAKLKIVEIPDGTDYEIGEYDGQEHVAEKHEVWS